MKINFICTKVCEKADREELAECEFHHREGTGVRLCSYEHYIDKALLDFYEEHYNSFRTINNVKAFKNLKLEFICDKKCKDWQNCKDRKGNICNDGIMIKKTIEREINKHCKDLFNNEALLVFAETKAKEIRRQIRKEDEKVPEEIRKERKPFFMHFSYVKGMSRPDIIKYLNTVLRVVSKKNRVKTYRKKAQ